MNSPRGNRGFRGSPRGFPNNRGWARGQAPSPRGRGRGRGGFPKPAYNNLDIIDVDIQQYTDTPFKQCSQVVLRWEHLVEAAHKCLVYVERRGAEVRHSRIYTYKLLHVRLVEIFRDVADRTDENEDGDAGKWEAHPAIS